MSLFYKSLKLAKKTTMNWVFWTIICSILANVIISSRPALAAEVFNGFADYRLESGNNINLEDKIIRILNPEVVLFEKNRLNPNHLPENSEREVSHIKMIIFSAYNSEVGQCDDSPCITANGFDVCKHDIEDTIAMNGIKLGTKIRIPELFGERVFEVRDRMNARYGSNRADIWMKNKKDAKQFGVRLARVEILK
jgi:3D (Asp-Asp-Asp) domain-containing protein